MANKFLYLGITIVIIILIAVSFNIFSNYQKNDSDDKNNIGLIGQYEIQLKTDLPTAIPNSKKIMLADQSILSTYKAMNVTHHLFPELAIDGFLEDPICFTSYGNSNHSVTIIKNSGAFMYSCLRDSKRIDKNLFTPDQALNLSLSFISKHSGLPANYQLVYIHGDESYNTTTNLSTNTISAYAIRFHQFINGIEVDGHSGEQICFLVDSNGVKSFYRFIRTPTGEEKNYNLCSAQEAFEKLKNSDNKTIMNLKENINIVKIDLIYYSKNCFETQYEFIPVWRFTSESGTTFYVGNDGLLY